MKIKFFNIPVSSTHDAEMEINSFIAQHRITHVDRQFVADGANSFLEYTEPSAKIRKV